MNFERNFYKASAVCPKCGSNDPKPKYIPPNHRTMNLQIDFWILACSVSRHLKEPESVRPNFRKFIIPEKVVNQCRCGYEWEEKIKKTEEV